MNSGRVAAGGARARVLAEEDDEEGARGERRCGRAARNPMLSAHLQIRVGVPGAATMVHTRTYYSVQLRISGF